MSLFPSIAPREAKAHATLLAIVAWSAVFWVSLSPGNRSPLGPVKWADFVQFYTSGRIADTGPMTELYDERARHVRQTEIVPESQSDYFTVAYPPLLSYLFLPLSRLSFTWAGWVWSTLSLSLLLVVALHSFDVSQDAKGLCIAIILAFPPTWQLFLFGQNSILIVLAFGGAYYAWTRKRVVLAGMVLGLLSMKPQFMPLVVVVALYSREWKLLVGMTGSVAIQLAITIVLFGLEAVRMYGRSLVTMALLTTAAEPKPYLQHSIRVMTSSLPAQWGTLVLVLASCLIVGLVLYVWRQTSDLRVRMGVLVLGTVLINPHLYIYDAVVLLLAGAWLSQVFKGAWFWRRAYWISAAMLLPTAWLSPLQLSVFLLVELLWRIAIHGLPSGPQATLSPNTV